MLIERDYREDAMYVLQFRLPGAAIWSKALPAPIQAAIGQAQVANEMLLAEEVRLRLAEGPSPTPAGRIDTRA